MAGPLGMHLGMAGSVKGAPNWAREIAGNLGSRSLFILSGNVRDVHPVPALDAGGREATGAVSLAWYVGLLLEREGYAFALRYDGERFQTLFGEGDLASAPGGEGRGDMLETAKGLLTGAEGPGLGAMVVEDASWVFNAGMSSCNETDARLRELRALCKWSLASRPSIPRRATGALRPARRYGAVFLLVDQDSDVPGWVTDGNPRACRVSIGKPGYDERRAIIAEVAPRLVPGAAAFAEPSQRETFLDGFTRQTEGLYAREIIPLCQEAQDRAVGPGGLGELAARRQPGAAQKNLWAELGESGLRKAEAFLKARVIGQDGAVRHAAGVIRRAASGLSGLPFGQGCGRPRGVMLFAGPTGVGKTALAKAMAELVFGSAGACLRFDMSEYYDAAAVSGLIGPPTGYKDAEVGGRLTNAVRKNPCSLLLFDEVEKAHPDVLDLFLQILDEGRLTDGQGGTVSFRDAIVVFTSNLGMDESVSASLPYDQVRKRVTAAVGEFFRFTIRRPELLNRIGPGNVVVFDYIRGQAARRIFDGMLDGSLRGIEGSQGVTLRIAGHTRDELASLACRDLAMGGRGIGNFIEEAVVTPVADALCELGGGREYVCVLGRDGAAGGRPAVRLVPTDGAERIFGVVKCAKRS